SGSRAAEAGEYRGRRASAGGVGRTPPGGPARGVCSGGGPRGIGRAGASRTGRWGGGSARRAPRGRSRGNFSAAGEWWWWMVGLVGFAAGEVGDDGRARHLGELRGGGVGDRGDAEEGEDFRLLGALALIRRVPDGVAGAERADQALQVVEVHGDRHAALALPS